MESERGEKDERPDYDMFKTISWMRLVELLCGSHPKKGEDGIKDAFEKLYNANLPDNYQSLD
jgi:hypothetical protein